MVAPVFLLMVGRFNLIHPVLEEREEGRERKNINKATLSIHNKGLKCLFI